jgi:hypothetical protein
VDAPFSPSPSRLALGAIMGSRVGDHGLGEAILSACEEAKEYPSAVGALRATGWLGGIPPSVTNPLLETSE